MTELFFDIESYSPVPINCGAHRYAEESEVLVGSWAFDDEPADVVDLTLGKGLPKIVLDGIRDPSVRIIGHNFGNFDRTVLRANGLTIEPHRIIDTMVVALSHGLPGSLERLGEIFGVAEEDAKLKTGKDLIQLFCKPRPKNMKLRRATRHTHPEKWVQFLDYAKQDIPSMRHIWRHMPRWNYPGVPGRNTHMNEYELWLLDQAINDRGFQVDTDLARAAIAAIAIEQEQHRDRIDDMTDGDVQAATQRDKLLQHILAEYGVTLPDMTKSTLERRLSDPDLPDPVRELIAIRLDAVTTSTAKYDKMLKSVSRDGRLRGTIQFCGAARTGRDAGRIFQPQNLPRTPDEFDGDAQETAVSAIKAGVAHLLYDSAIKEASKCLRGLIVAAPGKKLVVVDLAQIEARVLPWLAGEKWTLDAFRDYDAGEGPDLYRVTAGRVLKKDPQLVEKWERQRYGKVPSLACGYGGALGAFRAMEMGLGGEPSEEADIKEIVDGWRKSNPAIADWDTGLWAKLDMAARQAILNPGQVFEAGDYIRFEKWRSWLRMELPSGRFICFANAHITDDPKWKGRTTIAYQGINPYTRQWSMRYTYGAKISADATQATARDILFSNLPSVEQAGFPIVLRVHDELVTEPLDDVKYSVDKAVALITRRPSFVDEKLPLAADGFEAKRYRK